LNIEGTKETEIETIEKNREGLIGHIVDKLVGPKTEAVTREKYFGGISGRELRYMQIVKAAENKVKMEKTREQQRQNR
jgi:hypothetical protein